MKISIGILAHNESALISIMLDSLFQQSLLQKPALNIENIEILVIPNGCTDNTAEVATETLQKLSHKYSISSKVQWQVKELQQPGKSNAWNVCIHQLSAPDADYIFLMDSDIELLETTTLNSMIDVLEQNSDAWVSVDRPIKDITLKPQPNFWEKLSIIASQLSKGGNKIPGEPAWICGQLYCARSAILRQIWLPIDVINDDSFVYTNVVTNCLRSPENPQRVILADLASHKFEAYTDLSRLFNHEKWLIMGSTINDLIYQYLRSQKNSQPDISSFIKQRNEEDVAWLSKLLQKQIQQQGWWLIPRFFLIRRFSSLSNKSLPKAILFLPLALIAFVLDLWLSLQANLQLHQGKELGYWHK
jgi:glycosyltransferase involved in cell wall biosynthesis